VLLACFCFIASFLKLYFYLVSQSFADCRPFPFTELPREMERPQEPVRFDQGDNRL